MFNWLEILNLYSFILTSALLIISLIGFDTSEERIASIILFSPMVAYSILLAYGYSYIMLTLYCVTVIIALIISAINMIEDKKEIMLWILAFVPLLVLYYY